MKIPDRQSGIEAGPAAVTVANSMRLGSLLSRIFDALSLRYLSTCGAPRGARAIFGSRAIRTALLGAPLFHPEEGRRPVSKEREKLFDKSRTHLRRGKEKARPQSSP